MSTSADSIQEWEGNNSMLATLLCAVAVTPLKPNIVVILSDDVGFGDLSSYGATKVQTSNIDRIAKTGIRFTDAHSPSAVCTPTRYSLLTGRYAFRTKGGGAGILSGAAPYCLSDVTQTLPRMLQRAGYRTGIVGKWHLGLGRPAPNYNGLLEPGPREAGFNESFLLPATGDRVPCVYVENGRVVGLDPNDPIEVSFGRKIGNEPTGRDNPELLTLKPVVGHIDTIVNGVSRIGFMTGGKQARWVDEDMADVFAAKADAFIKRNRHSPFFLFLSTHDVHAPLLPNHRFNGASRAGLRGDTLAELDWTVGEVYKSLDRLELTRNTIIIFTSDNGAAISDGYSDPRENLNGHDPHGGLRGEKYTHYEGGHRVPFVASWPDRIPGGKTSGALICQIDLMASFASLLGIKLRKDEAPDSTDLLAALLGNSGRGRFELVHHRGGANTPLGFRQGDWVMVPNPQGAQLFNLKKDLAQKQDLAPKEPNRVKAMAARLAEIIGEQ